MQSTSCWGRYREKHKFERLDESQTLGKKLQCVAVYRRGKCFYVDYWDRETKKKVKLKQSSLVAALAKAQEIDEKLLLGHSTGHFPGVAAAALVDRYIADLKARADGGHIQVSTVRRFGSALTQFLAFVAGRPQAADMRKCDRKFVLDLQAAMRAEGDASARYNLACIRTMVRWACDKDKGNCLPHEVSDLFRNIVPKAIRIDPVRSLDITVDMAVAFVAACDEYQLRLFAPLLLWGLRAEEPAMLLGESLRDHEIRVGAIPELYYNVKGKRDKYLPVTPMIGRILRPHGKGLIILRRSVVDGSEKPPLLGSSLADLAKAVQSRLPKGGASSAAEREKVRASVVHDAGGTSYDDIYREFRKVAAKLGWPPAASLKDFRHLFATLLSNAGVPEPYIQHFMGHAPSRDAITHYRHLSDRTAMFNKALNSTLRPILNAFDRRTRRSMVFLGHFLLSQISEAAGSSNRGGSSRDKIVATTGRATVAAS